MLKADTLDFIKFHDNEFIRYENFPKKIMRLTKRLKLLNDAIQEAARTHGHFGHAEVLSYYEGLNEQFSNRTPTRTEPGPPGLLLSVILKCGASEAGFHIHYSTEHKTLDLVFNGFANVSEDDHIVLMHWIAFLWVHKLGQAAS